MRIEFDDDLRNDPRFTDLCERIGKLQAYGSLILLWELGASYWKKKTKDNIPLALAKRLQNFEALCETGFARVESDDSVYCSGAQERWQYFHIQREQRAAAGRASAEARLKRDGSALPRNASNRTTTERDPNETERSRTASERAPNETDRRSDFVAENSERNSERNRTNPNSSSSFYKELNPKKENAREMLQSITDDRHPTQKFHERMQPGGQMDAEQKVFLRLVPRIEGALLVAAKNPDNAFATLSKTLQDERLAKIVLAARREIAAVPVADSNKNFRISAILLKHSIQVDNNAVLIEPERAAIESKEASTMTAEAVREMQARAGLKRSASVT